MTEARWRQINEAFAAALSGGSDGRDELLSRLQADDPLLASEVEALLAADASAADFLKTPPPVPAELLAQPRVDLSADDRLGPYRILRELGRGGMGAVYLAERADGQYRQRVAIKVLHPDLDMGDAAARFLAERQILASLTHPGIARLLDGGTTPDGRPYLVMAHIEGVPITAYCTGRGLTVAARLSLFVGVCRAVGYAHRNLLVHRDLKASNILVTETGQPKLLDFGIAKLLRPAELPHGAPATRTGSHPMTPACASPEQVRGESVTTASDVYQLGLLLYEILSGVPPYYVDSRSPREIERIICESRPEPLPGKLAADLNTIVSMALRKEPERRFGSADHLADDLERFLAGRPVSARSDTWGYRASTFVRRNRWAVAAAGAVALLLVALAAVSLRFAATAAEQSRAIAVERDRAMAGEARAEQVTEFMVTLFESALPGAERRDTLTVRAVLGQAGERIDHALADEPAIRATLLNAVGRILYSLGAVDQAQEHTSRALALRRDLHQGPHPDLIRSLFALATQNREGFHFAKADTLYREALALQHELPGADSLLTAALLQGWASALRDLGRADTAVLVMREMVGLRARLQGVQHPEYLGALGTLAYALRGAGELDEGERLYGEVLAGLRAGGEAVRSRLPGTLNDLAFLLLEKGEYEAAEPLYREAIEIQGDLFGDAHLRTLSYMGELGNALRRAGKFDEAEGVAREAVQRATRHYPESSWELGAEHIKLGFTLFLREDYAAAAESFRTGMDIFAVTLGPEHLWTAAAEHSLGSALELGGRTDEAGDHLEHSLSILERQPLRVSTLLNMDNLRVLIAHLRARGDTTAAARYEAFLALDV